MTALNFEIVPPLVTLVLATAWSRVAGIVGKRMLAQVPDAAQSQEQTAFTHCVAQDRVLQTNCFVAFASLISTIVAAAGRLPVSGLWLLVLVSLAQAFALIDVFSHPLGYHSRTIIIGQWNRRRWTRENLYNFFIGFLAVVQLALVLSGEPGAGSATKSQGDLQLGAPEAALEGGSQDSVTK